MSESSVKDGRQSGVAGATGPFVKLGCGDCRELMGRIPDGSVDAVITDPPYGMGWNTDCTRFSARNKYHRKSAAGRDWKAPVSGDDEPFDPSPWLEYPKVILWGFNHFASSLPVGTTLVWVKRNEAAFGSFLSDAELGWMKGGHGVYLHKDLSMNALAKKRIHPNQKPVGLLRWCIRKLKLAPGSVILDPFMGSGSTGEAAILEGHSFIGIELVREHFENAKQRLSSVIDQARRDQSTQEPAAQDRAGDDD